MSFLTASQKQILDSLADATEGSVEARMMLGTVGVYANGQQVGLLKESALYFRANDATRARYESTGGAPFSPGGRSTPPPYYRVPAEVLDDAAALASWMRWALDAAI